MHTHNADGAWHAVIPAFAGMTAYRSPIFRQPAELHTGTDKNHN